MSQILQMIWNAHLSSKALIISIGRNSEKLYNVWYKSIFSTERLCRKNLLRSSNLLFSAARDERNETDSEVVTVKLRPWPRYAIARCPRNEREMRREFIRHVLRQDSAPSTSPKMILPMLIDVMS